MALPDRITGDEPGLGGAGIKPIPENEPRLTKVAYVLQATELLQSDNPDERWRALRWLEAETNIAVGLDLPVLIKRSRELEACLPPLNHEEAMEAGDEDVHGTIGSDNELMAVAALMAQSGKKEATDRLLELAVLPTLADYHKVVLMRMLTKVPDGRIFDWLWMLNRSGANPLLDYAQQALGRYGKPDWVEVPEFMDYMRLLLEGSDVGRRTAAITVIGNCLDGESRERLIELLGVSDNYREQKALVQTMGRMGIFEARDYLGGVLRSGLKNPREAELQPERVMQLLGDYARQAAEAERLKTITMIETTAAPHIVLENGAVAYGLVHVLRSAVEAKEVSEVVDTRVVELLGEALSQPFMYDPGQVVSVLTSLVSRRKSSVLGIRVVGYFARGWERLQQRKTVGIYERLAHFEEREMVMAMVRMTEPDTLSRWKDLDPVFVGGMVSLLKRCVETAASMEVGFRALQRMRQLEETFGE